MPPKPKITQVGAALQLPLHPPGLGRAAHRSPREPQETFDESVKSNIDDFDMEASPQSSVNADARAPLGGGRPAAPRRPPLDMAPQSPHLPWQRARLDRAVRELARCPNDAPTAPTPRSQRRRCPAPSRSSTFRWGAAGGAQLPRPALGAPPPLPQNARAQLCALPQGKDLSSIIKTVKGGDTSGWASRAWRTSTPLRGRDAADAADARAMQAPRGARGEGAEAAAGAGAQR
jgi:hypothetical protein